MPLVISLPTSGKSTTSVVLDSRVVSLTTSWNALGQFWSMDIKDSLGALLLTGVPLVPNQPLLKAHPVVADALGEFVVAEKAEGDYQVQSNMGVQVVLLWYRPGEEIRIPD